MSGMGVREGYLVGRVTFEGHYPGIPPPPPDHTPEGVMGAGEKGREGEWRGGERVPA